MTESVDAAVIGAGPNGLAAAITLAEAGRSVIVYEARDEIGGGMRTDEGTLEGFAHDVCSAVHPLLLASPFFRHLRESVDFDLCHPEIPMVNPLDGGRAAVAFLSLDETAGSLGRDGPAYRKTFAPLVRNVGALMDEILGPLRIPRHPLVLARFGLKGLLPAARFARMRFDTPEARALTAGCAAHSMLPLEKSPTTAFGLVLQLLIHAVGWPLVRGGSGAIGDAMAARLTELGGEIRTGHPVTALAELPQARAYLFDTGPGQMVSIAGDRLPRRYARAVERFRYGMGVFKVDWALSDPVPWAAPAARRAGTVHVGGTLDEVAHSERVIADGSHPERPFVLLAQPTVADPTRAPAGKQVLWGYCHVPTGSTRDMTGIIESQIERFAPGFKDTILARRTMDPAQLEEYNRNYVGGDINGGAQDIFQTFTRPVRRAVPYTTPAKDIYICSSSTPPGGGVHGMSGYHAARAALRRAF